MTSGISDELRAELLEAFNSSKTGQEMVQKFQEMETCFQDSELGEQCFMVADKFFREKRIDQVISFGRRALHILAPNYAETRDAETAFLVSRVLCLLGSAHFELRIYEDSVGYLTDAYDVLSLLKENCCTLLTLLLIQTDLCISKCAMGRNDEGLVHAIKGLEIKEQVFESVCVELAEAYKEVAEVCTMAGDEKRALTYCLKAKEMYAKCLGSESEEVGQVTRYIALLYCHSGEREKGFEYNQVAMNVLRKRAPDSADMVKAEIDSGTMMAELGRHQEAVDILKGVLGRNELEEMERMRLSVNMSRALCHLKKFADARKYLIAAQRTLEQDGMYPLSRCIGFIDMSDMYEMMNDFDTAISLIKSALAVTEIPQNILATLSNRLFSLLLASGKEKEGILYLEGVLKRLKKSFGPKHEVVGSAYGRMGIVHANSGQNELAVKYMVKAKAIMDASVGPHHLSSLQISHDLSLTYANLGRFLQALQIEEKVVEGLKGLPTSELGFMHKVNKHLSAMRDKVAESPTTPSITVLKMTRLFL